ncbi:MAG TPA: alanine--tRNA ligase, partial [Candidatus Limnocylindria bacterium]|nr:alanine--tRNA ligase [Candidatus Limnocylindria bacterium]
KDVSIRVVAEHSRAAAFLIADGIQPSNEMRGYVLRRLIRRGALHARKLGLKPGAMAAVGTEVVKNMQAHYKELTSARERIPQILRDEEEKFERTLSTGLEQLNAAIAAARGRGGSRIDGDTTFRLYDTYGFPLEMTREIAHDSGLSIDEPGFRRLLDEQRSRSRASAVFRQDHMKFGQLYGDLREKQGLTSEFTGYDELSTEATAISLVVGGRQVDEASEGTDVEIVLDRTPFYPEGGGQVGDRGDVTSAEGRAMVADTQTAAPNVIVMSAKVVDGTIRTGAKVTAKVDGELRRHTMRNHTATHLLHATLRRILGDDVHQAGSLVHAPNLRFDFTFDRALTPEELARVEDEVNAAILDNVSVRARTMPLQDALASGAVHLFDERYGDEVRVVEAGPSKELCGGTHCHCTGDIGVFLITKEESIGAGVRRIEALTGEGALREIREARQSLGRAAAMLRVPAARVPDAVADLRGARERLEKEIESAQRSGVESAATGLVAKAIQLDGARVVVSDVGEADDKQLKALADKVRDGLGTGVAILGGTREGRAYIAIAVSKDLAGTVSAGALVKEVAPIFGGNGGGPPTSATGGGKEPARLGTALETAERSVRARLGSRGG